METFLSKCGVAFQKINVKEVKVMRQFQNVDLIVGIQLRERRLCLLVEDKIDAPFGNPMEKYVDKVFAHRDKCDFLRDIPKEAIFPIIFKSGYDFDLVPPTHLSPNKCAKVNWEDLDHWAKSLAETVLARSDILRDWIDCYRKKVAEIRAIEAQVDAHLNGEGKPHNQEEKGLWSGKIFQYILLKRIFRVDPARITRTLETSSERRVWFRPEYNSSEEEFLSQETNKGGGNSFIQYWFGTPRPAKDLFYRLDYYSPRRKGRWTISVRYLKEHKTPEDIGMMDEFAALLSRLCRDAGVEKADFTRRDGKAESPFFAIDPGNGSALPRLYDVHRKFLEEAFN